MPDARWIDSHCHLTDDQFADDLGDVLGRAGDVGVDRIVAVGDDLDSSRAALELARRHPGVYATAGVHPHNALQWNDAAARALRDILRDGTFVAVGETGLDLHYGADARDAQIDAFLAQADVAREFRLPLVIHCRDGDDLLLDLVRANDLGAVGGVVHCFQGTPAHATALVDQGFRLGVTGLLTFKKNGHLPEVVRSVPLDALVLETDAPYLAPRPRRGRRNQPAYLIHTARRLADELGIDPHDLARRTRANALALFRIDDGD